MPCNGWRHPPYCECGWGGVGYGSGQAGLQAEALRRLAREIWSSYVNPNARCPVCDASVFFYQSPHGGRVYFDHLGAPWPKHECTDTRRKAPPAIPYAPWLEDGWLPLARFTPTRGRPTRDVLESLAGAVLVSAYDAAETNVLWPVISRFDWDGPVFLRRVPGHPHLIEVQTIELRLGEVRVLRLVAVLNDPSALTPTLLDRLSRSEDPPGG